MLKNLWIAAIFVMLQVAPLRPYTQAQSADHPKTTQANQKPETPAVIIANVDNHQSRGECSKKNAVADHDPDKWIRRGFWTNVALMFITAGIGIATLFQAIAAKRQASYIVSSERAWIESEIREQPIPGFMQEIKEKPDTWGLGISIALRNTGKTVCRVLDSHLRIDVVDSINPNARPVVPNLPEKPIYRVSSDNKPAEIAPKGTVWLPNKQFNYGGVIPKKYFVEKDLYGLQVADKVLCMYGFVEYEDAFKKKRITKFCYAYIPIRTDFAMTSEKTGELLMPPGFVLSGPPTYNEST